MLPLVRSAEEVARGVWVTTSRRDTTTTTFVVDPDGSAVVVDPAWEVDELDGLAALVEHRGWQLTAGLTTHAHHDHLLWHPRWEGVPRYGSARTVELAGTHRTELVAAMGPDLPAPFADLLGRVTPLPPSAPPGVEVLVHDGHAPGHTAYLWPERGVLAAGDMLSDLELPLPLDPDDLPAYLEGLDRLAPFVARARVLVPGHGTPTTAPLARLDADRRYLDDVLAGRPVDDPRATTAGMAAVHERVVALAARLREAGGR